MIPSCKPLSNHSSPKRSDSIGKWIGTLAIENSIPFSILISHIGSFARNCGLYQALSMITNVAVDEIVFLEDEFRDRFWENPLDCPIKGCEYHSADLNGHLAKRHGFGLTPFGSSDQKHFPSKLDLEPSHKNAPIWPNRSIWDEINNYPPLLKIKFLELKAAVNGFLMDRNNLHCNIQHQLPDRFLEKFTKYLTNGYNLNRAFTRAGGLLSDFGVDWSLYQIKSYFQKNHRSPEDDIHPFCSIYYCCKKGAFKKWGIYSWTGFLQRALGSKLYYRSVNINFKSKEGLTRACAYLRQFKLENNRVPTVIDSGVKLIYNAIQRGIWVKFGIRTRYDLLYHVFGRECDSYRVWEGLEGLNKARTKLKSYYKQHGCMPKRDFDGHHGIRRVFQDGLWKNYGIQSWEDLVQDVFISQEIILD